MGPQRMIKELEEMSYKPVAYPNAYVGFIFTIPHGRFRNQQVEIALLAAQFPDIPPPGPNIKPFLLPIKGEHGEHPYHGIHQRNTPTAEFQYWSRPIDGWDQTAKNMRVYLAFLRRLFDFE